MLLPEDYSKQIFGDLSTYHLNVFARNYFAALHKRHSGPLPKFYLMHRPWNHAKLQRIVPQPNNFKLALVLFDEEAYLYEARNKYFVLQTAHSYQCQSRNSEYIDLVQFLVRSAIPYNNDNYYKLPGQ